MSVVVDFEEKRHRENNERLLGKIFVDDTVLQLTALRSKKNFHLLARVSGIVLGSLVAVPLEGKNKGIVQVLALAVEPSQRHHGIARSMLKALVEESRREYHRYVIAPGPRHIFEMLEWTEVEDIDVARYPVENYQEDELPLDGWWSTPTRSLTRRMLRKIPDPAGLYTQPLKIQDNIHPTTSRFG